jgi:hypothetical protein
MTNDKPPPPLQMTRFNVTTTLPCRVYHRRNRLDHHDQSAMTQLNGSFECFFVHLWIDNNHPTDHDELECKWNTYIGEQRTRNQLVT